MGRKEVLVMCSEPDSKSHSNTGFAETDPNFYFVILAVLVTLLSLSIFCSDLDFPSFTSEDDVGPR
jgi:hypothetical protein